MVKTTYVDEELLNEYIDKSGYKVGFLAETLGISLTAFYKKKHGSIPFRASEIFTLCSLLNIDQDMKQKIFVTR